jgi:hypothetical protein
MTTHQATGRTALATGAVAFMLALSMGIMGSARAQQGEVWKCKQRDGSVAFSDVPCPGAGEPLEPRRLQINVADAPRLPATADKSPDGAAAQPPVNDCPGDLELRNMETRANSTSLGDKERAFMQDEIRRVRQCRKGQGRYTAEDWALSREAQNAQSSSNAEKARLRAEGMHSAADPLEGERIARQRETEAIAERNLARMQKRQRATPPSLCPPGAAASGTKNAVSCR